MDYSPILGNTKNIIENLNFMEGNVSKIKRKIGVISKVYQKLEKNKILVNQSKETFLVFQTNILKNEYKYYQNLYQLMIQKYAEEVFELSEYIVMVLVSLNKLEIDNSEKKTNLLNQMITLKKPQHINYGKLNEIISATVNNLKLVEQFIKLYEGFLNKTLKNNEKANIHNNNFEVTIKSKKESILLEYQKYTQRFEKLIQYFKNGSDSIVNQISTSEVLKFFLLDKNN